MEAFLAKLPKLTGLVLSTRLIDVPVFGTVSSSSAIRVPGGGLERKRARRCGGVLLL